MEGADGAIDSNSPKGPAVGLESIRITVGPSGTGKTTLLRAMGGLTPTVSGSVLVHGKELDGPPKDVVIVFQDYSNALLQWRTVAANVAFGIERSLDRGEIEQRVHDALARVGLEKNAEDYPWQLSGGMQQRVQIARALALRPAVMLMDEPFAALDAMTKASMQDELLRVRDRTGTSFVFITHDIEEALLLADTVCVMTARPGRIKKRIAVELARPRTIEATTSPVFNALKREVLALLREESVRADAETALE